MVHRAPRSCLCLPTWRAPMLCMPLRLEAGFSLVHITLSSIHPLVPHSSTGRIPSGRGAGVSFGVALD